MILRPFSRWVRREAARRRQNERDRQAEARMDRAVKPTPDEELVKRRGKAL